MRLWLGAFVSLGVVVFSACGNDYDSNEPTNASPDGGKVVATSSSGNSSSGNVSSDGGGGPFSEEEKLPCDGRTADDAFSVFVAAGGADGPSCGTREAPCSTVQGGITTAYAVQKPKVLIGPGTYTEAITLDGGLILEGGWAVSGPTWTADCGAGHSSVATIQAPGAVNTSVKATKGASVLRFLTMKSKPIAAAGESLYGLMAIGPNVKVAIDDSHFIIAGGGNGAAGFPGMGFNDRDCTSVGDGKPGTNGTPGPAGPAGNVSGAGYTPSAGADGQPGGLGHMGTQADNPTPVTYDACVSGVCDPSGSVTPLTGRSGCGGGGGHPGKGGAGGGSSIGIISSDALVVTYGGSVTTGAGGDGGAGGSGASGEPGTPGDPGILGHYTKAKSTCQLSVECEPEAAFLPGGPPGGTGGQGGMGGQGGGGAGGWSVSFVKLGSGALLAATTTVFTTGAAGKGGASNGAEGLRQQQWP